MTQALNSEIFICVIPCREALRFPGEVVQSRARVKGDSRWLSISPREGNGEGGRKARDLMEAGDGTDAPGGLFQGLETKALLLLYGIFISKKYHIWCFS